MRNAVVALVGVGCLWLCCRCASNPKCNFNIERRNITIITEPEGANVVQIKPLGQGSTTLGKTPIQEQPVVVIQKITKLQNMPYAEAETLYKHVGAVYVVIEKDGYVPYKGYLKTEPEKTTVHQITLQRKE